MKKVKLIFTMLIFGFTISKSLAQVSTVADAVNNSKSYWQLSSRVGYDFPLFDEDFKYIEYKGGIMGGLSVNKYWNNWGFQIDGDYIKNTPKTNIGNPVDFIYQPSAGVPTLLPLDVSTQKKDITRMFFGIGPAYKWQSASNKFTVEFAAMGGIGIIDGGEILVEGNNKVLTSPIMLTYHSGFDNQKVPTLKAQIRATYWFKGGNWGVNGGAYYMNHFGVKESTVNPILISKGYAANNDFGGAYLYEIGQETTETHGTTQSITGFSEDGEGVNYRGYEVGTDFNEQKKIKLASVGVFAGLSYRFITPKKVKPVVEPVVEKKKEEPAKKYCLQVTAKDKFTKETLPNTDVALKNSKGEVVGTAKTDAFGITKFCDISPDDYTIAGVLNEVPLEGNVANKSEFKNEQTLLKDINYADRNFIVKGKAFECNSTTPISGINVVLENTDKAFKKSTTTDANGNFMLQLPEEGTYSLYGRKESYFSQTETVTASNYSRDKSLFVKLEICAEKADCGKGLGLKNILFDLDKYAIKDIAKVELNRLVRFMQDNPTVKVEVGSHTDCRSSAAYNQKLSQNRANSSVDYVVSQGISRDRISGKGYGESKLLNECADGVKCSEDQHSINRRTEMKVICPEKK